MTTITRWFASVQMATPIGLERTAVPVARNSEATCCAAGDQCTGCQEETESQSSPQGHRGCACGCLEAQEESPAEREEAPAAMNENISDSENYTLWDYSPYAQSLGISPRVEFAAWTDSTTFSNTTLAPARLQDKAWLMYYRLTHWLKGLVGR